MGIFIHYLKEGNYFLHKTSIPGTMEENIVKVACAKNFKYKYRKKIIKE